MISFTPTVEKMKAIIMPSISVPYFVAWQAQRCHINEINAPILCDVARYWFSER
jgi:hypothetical protein